MGEAASQREVTKEVLATLPPIYGEAVDHILANIPDHLSRPQWGIVCGSGLAGLGDVIEEKVLVAYDKIPVGTIPDARFHLDAYASTSQGFAQSTVHGHHSSLAFGYLTFDRDAKRVPIVAALGRFHIYEGHSPEAAVFPVRTMRCLGAKAVILTNAAGGLHPRWPIGTIMNMHDHIGLPTLTVSGPTPYSPQGDAHGPLLPCRASTRSLDPRFLWARDSHLYRMLTIPSSAWPSFKQHGLWV